MSAAERPPSGKRCLVLGGSGAIGQSVCDELASAGARVGFTFRNGEKAANAIREKHPSAIARRVDAGNVGDLERALDELSEALGGVDALIHCIGVGTTSGATAARQETMLDVDERAWDQLMSVNLKSAFFACRRVVPHLTRAGGGDLILIGSIDGVKPVPAPVHYGASKGALVGMARTMSKELGPASIRVNVVAPGVLGVGVATTLPSELRAEYLKHCGLKRFGQPAEVARVVSWLALHNTYVTGQTILLDGAL